MIYLWHILNKTSQQELTSLAPVLLKMIIVLQKSSLSGVCVQCYKKEFQWELHFLCLVPFSPIKICLKKFGDDPILTSLYLKMVRTIPNLLVYYIKRI